MMGVEQCRHTDYPVRVSFSMQFRDGHPTGKVTNRRSCPNCGHVYGIKDTDAA